MNILNQKITSPSDINPGDNSLAFQPYYMLAASCGWGKFPTVAEGAGRSFGALSAFCAQLEPTYQLSLVRTISIIKDHKTPFYNIIAHLCSDSEGCSSGDGCNSGDGLGFDPGTDMFAQLLPDAVQTLQEYVTRESIPQTSGAFVNLWLQLSVCRVSGPCSAARRCVRSWCRQICPGVLVLNPAVCHPCIVLKLMFGAFAHRSNTGTQWS